MRIKNLAHGLWIAWFGVGVGGMVGFTLHFAVGLQPDGHCPSEKPSPFPLKPHLGGLHWQEAHGKSFQGEIFKIGTEK